MARFALSLLLLSMACAHAPPPPVTYNSPSVPPGEAAFAQGARPGWLDNTPNDPAALYAVGTSGPTYYPDDASKFAAEKARANLGLAISSHIENVVLAVQSTGRNYTDQATAVEATHDYSDTIVENSQIIATWIDRSGSYSGQAGTAYALARLDKAKIGLPTAPTPVSAPTH